MPRGLEEGNPKRARREEASATRSSSPVAERASSPIRKAPVATQSFTQNKISMSFAKKPVSSAFMEPSSTKKHLQLPEPQRQSSFASTRPMTPPLRRSVSPSASISSAKSHDSIESATSADVERRLPKRLAESFLDKHVRRIPASVSHQDHAEFLKEKTQEIADKRFAPGQRHVPQSTVLGMNTGELKDLYRGAKTAQKRGELNMHAPKAVEIPIRSSVATAFPHSSSIKPTYTPSGPRNVYVKGERGRINHFDSQLGIPPKRK